MRFRVVRSSAASRDVTENAIWWADHRSREQAVRWLDLAILKLESLGNDPSRHPPCDENFAIPDVTIRQLNFGFGPRPTHRILFSVTGSEVFVY